MEARHPRAHEQHDPGVEQREQQQAGGVRERRVRDLLAVGEVEGPVGVAGRPGRDAGPIRIQAARSRRSDTPRAMQIRAQARSTSV